MSVKVLAPPLISGPLTITGTLTVSSTIQSTAGNVTGTGLTINRSGTTYVVILDDGDGYARFYNGATTSFNGIKFGGATNSQPALYVDGAGIKVVGAAGGSTSWIKIPPVTVASLPAAATAGSGARSTVSDANATTFGSIVAGGGANIMPVISNGTNWLIG